MVLKMFEGLFDLESVESQEAIAEMKRGIPRIGALTLVGTFCLAANLGVFKGIEALQSSSPEASALETTTVAQDGTAPAQPVLVAQ